MDIDITNNQSEKRFQAAAGKSSGFLYYSYSGSEMTLVHTEVPDELGGRGLGGKLVKFALEYARQQGLKIKAECPFAQGYIKRHEEYSDVLS